MAADDSVIYAGSSLGIYRSTDAGNSWEHIFPTFSYAYSMYCNDGILIVGGTNINKMYLTKDHGITWSDLSTGMDFLGGVYTFCKDGDYLYAGTQSGVWKRSLFEITTDVKNEKSSLLPDFYLSQNYPNPFNPSTTINYSIPVETLRATSLQHVTIKVYDVLGREVATLVDEEKPAGNYEITFNANKLSSGIYYYRIISNGFIESKKMTFLK
ncbi:MAG: T9SS C-terminal target domain-containing protein [Ignavibacteriales bacterium]|nr:MAG: T9SS C-terminal target domain-containing protein [Ignavibacteriales bacterium]